MGHPGWDPGTEKKVSDKNEDNSNELWISVTNNISIWGH